MARISADALGYSTAALQAGNIAEAIAIRNQKEGIVAGSNDHLIAKKIEILLSRTPKALADCPTDILEPLRIVAALMTLWGVNSIRQFATIEGELGYRMSAEAVAQSLSTYAAFLGAIQGFKEVGIEKVELLPAGLPDECETCRATNGKVYPVDQVPELPLEGCSCEKWCRVWVVAVG